MTAMQLQYGYGCPLSIRRIIIKTKMSSRSFDFTKSRKHFSLTLFVMQKRSESQHFKLPCRVFFCCVNISRRKKTHCVEPKSKLHHLQRKLSFSLIRNQSFKINVRERFVLFSQLNTCYISFLLGLKVRGER